MHIVKLLLLCLVCCLFLLLQKFRVNFLNVVQGPSFHRCVYILVAKEQAIMAAGAAAQQAYGKQAAEYMPHLSLLYADVDDAARAASQQAAVQRLYGEGSDYKTLLTDNGFVAEAISLWYTPVEDRTLASWKQVAEVQLS
jgi:ABC-type molybdate transport system substrate-binding protein